MAQVETKIADSLLNLDVCPGCPAIWFDSSEYQSVPRQPPPLQIEKHMSPMAREKLAMLQVQQIAKQQDDAASFEAPDETWQWVPGVLGLPVELDAPAATRKPWITWGLIAVCFITTISTLPSAIHHVNPTVEEWGFIPAQWDRHVFLTLITSFFLHGGLVHLLGNMYFLFIFGDNVEDRLGHSTYLLTIFAAHITGLIVQAAFTPAPETPCIGASAGISGVIALYAILFPRIRLAFMFRYFVYFRWFRVRALWALVLYALLQVLGTNLQLYGFGHVAYLAHGGGLAMGICFGLAYRYSRRSSAESAVV